MAAKLWPVLSSLLIAVVAFGTMLTLTQLPLVSLLELKSLDLLFLLRGRLSPPPEIIIVAIDEPSFAEISRQWPWPRSIHARLVEHLNKGGARVIGFDVLFAECYPHDDQPVPGPKVIRRIALRTKESCLASRHWSASKVTWMRAVRNPGI
jgi:CHASE2 domain-containing sensor protein